MVPRIASYALLDLDKDEDVSTPKQVRLALPCCQTSSFISTPNSNLSILPPPTPLQVLLSPGSPDLGFTIGQFSSQGRRAHMEDRVLVRDLTGVPPFDVRAVKGGEAEAASRGWGAAVSRAVLLGVFDGHAGRTAAQPRFIPLCFFLPSHYSRLFSATLFTPLFTPVVSYHKLR